MPEIPLIGVKKCAVCGAEPPDGRLWQQEDGGLRCIQCNLVGLLMSLHQKVNILAGAVDGLARTMTGAGEPIQ